MVDCECEALLLLPDLSFEVLSEHKQSQLENLSTFHSCVPEEQNRMPPERKKSGLLLLLSTPGSYKATTVGETHWNDAIIVRIISHRNWMSLGEVPGAFSIAKAF